MKCLLIRRLFATVALGFAPTFAMAEARDIQPDTARTTLYVDKGVVYTASGEVFVMRGFNEMFAWSNDIIGEFIIPEIAKSGANTLRLVWDRTRHSIGDLRALIENTVEHKMVAIPECHSATGKWGAELRACVDFWNHPELIDAIEHNKRWSILNIANEAGNGAITDEMFVSFYSEAIKDIRRWGYTVPIMIDASSWGQNVDQLIRVGAELLDIDPLANIIFSTHSYWPADKAIAKYGLVARAARDHGLAIVIGEGPSVTRFGDCDNPATLPYLDGMRILDESRVGWLNWSWGAVMNSDCDQFKYFDLTVSGKFGHWTHPPGANIVASSQFSVMRTSVRPASFYEGAMVEVAGIFIDLGARVDANTLRVGETRPFDVIVAPVNASQSAYRIELSGVKNAISIDTKSNTLTAISAGTVTIKAQSLSSSMSWSTTVTVLE